MARPIGFSWGKCTVAIAAFLASVLVRPAPLQAGGCARDSECKGARICENGRCIDPAKSAEVRGAPGAAQTAQGAVSPVPVLPQPAPPPARVETTQSPPYPGTPAPPVVTGPPAIGNTAPPPPGPSGAPPVTMLLTDAQFADLRSAGASLDAKDMEIADRLGRRGFSGDDLVAAYREYNALKVTYPEFGRFGREMVETIAVAHKLGLGENDRYWLVWDHHDRDLSLTDTYNRRVIGGPGLRTAAWVMSGIGAALVVGGAILYNEESFCDLEYSPCQKHVTGSGWAGLGFAIGGGALIAIGVSSLIVGYVRMSNWLAPGTLDTAPADSIRSLRASDSGAREPAIRWAVTPLLSPNQAGLGLRAVF